MDLRGLAGAMLKVAIDEMCGRGTYVHKNPPNEFDVPCPFCGAFDHIYFSDEDWNGDQSSPDDVFECVVCGATSTRRDHFGAYDTASWDKDDVKGFLKVFKSSDR